MADITVAQKQAYTAGFILAFQQTASKLRGAVRDDGVISGKRVFFDKIGAETANRRTTRNQDTTPSDPNHTRRAGVMYPYSWARLVDPVDVRWLGKDPTDSYTRNGIMAFNRSIDDEIIASSLGTAYEGESGETATAFLAAQQIVHGGVGLTLDKLIDLRAAFMANEVPEDEPLYFAYTSNQLKDLLNDNKLTSADYNTVKVLAAGRLEGTWMGFNWINSERLSKSGTTRSCIAWAKSAMGMIVSEDIKVRIGERADKSYVTQIYVEMDIGAVRIMDEGVFEVQCTE